ncbi:MAG TPA: hypothetical protein VFB60_05165 [Ktedonobacteraceae bacterium]|nr:hypothetical protein [Ktedonobacteraceae bacterium]
MTIPRTGNPSLRLDVQPGRIIGLPCYNPTHGQSITPTRSYVDLLMEF